MNYKFVSVPSFTREVKRLSKRYRSLKSDLIKLQTELMMNPALGTDLGGGLRILSTEKINRVQRK